MGSANSAGEPEWWTQAQALEQQDRLKEAEQLLLASIDHLGVCSQTAHLYELRMQRLLRAGGREGAEEAGGKARDWW